MPSKQKLAVEVKVQQTAMPARRVKMYYEYLIRWRNRFKPGELSESQVYKYLRYSLVDPSPFWPRGESFSAYMYNDVYPVAEEVGS